MGLHYYSYEAKDIETGMVVTGTFVGYLIILLGVYAGYLFTMPISKRIVSLKKCQNLSIRYLYVRSYLPR